MKNSLWPGAPRLPLTHHRNDTMSRVNRQILLRRRPNGLVSPDDTEMVTVPTRVPADGEALC